MAGIESAWSHITAKRNECDAVVSKIPGVALFFSAISTYQSAKRDNVLDSVQPSDEEEDVVENQSLETTSSTLSSQVPESITKCSKSKTYPSITYWVAIQSANGAPVDALVLHSALVQCEVEVNSTRASAKKGGGDILNKLCQLLKDHKNNFMTDLVIASYKCCRDELFREITGESLEEEQPLLQWDQVVRMVVIRPEISPSLAVSVKRLRAVGLYFDLYDVKNLLGQENTVDPPKQLGEPLTVLCNDIERALKKLNYGYREGDVYKKHPKSKYTYFRLCSMESFLNSLLGNAQFKDRLLSNMGKLQVILRHPDCQAISQFEIDRDLVEVNEGWCWSFRRNKFLDQPFNASHTGRTSPRAFISYDHDDGDESQVLQRNSDQQSK
ncbi:hypothetical protein QZH41_000025 [Actinostola sp. cb2023]|nr:hypothetical protein QZH41_000025 [Actinostola sp. cb2023]